MKSDLQHKKEAVKRQHSEGGQGNAIAIGWEE